MTSLLKTLRWEDIGRMSVEATIAVCFCILYVYALG